MIFRWAAEARLYLPVRPNLAGELAVYLRTGPFWQDVARTVPATSAGDPVKAWDTPSVSGWHLTWSSGNVPTLRSGGGITCGSGGAQLEAAVSTGGSTSWSVYVTCSDSDTTDYGWVLVEGNPGTPLTGFGSAYASGGQLATGIGGSYNTTAGADAGGLATRGMSVAGTAVTSFVGATEVSSSAGAMAALGAIRLGTYGGTFSFVGDIVNAAVYSTTDGPTERGAARSFLATS